MLWDCSNKHLIVSMSQFCHFLWDRDIPCRSIGYFWLNLSVFLLPVLKWMWNTQSSSSWHESSWLIIFPLTIKIQFIFHSPLDYEIELVPLVRLEMKCNGDDQAGLCGLSWCVWCKIQNELCWDPWQVSWIDLFEFHEWINSSCLEGTTLLYKLLLSLFGSTYHVNQ